MECNDSRYTKSGCPPFASLLLLVGLPTRTEEGLRYVPKSANGTQAILDHEKSNLAADLATGGEAGAPSNDQQEPTEFWKEKSPS